MELCEDYASLGEKLIDYMELAVEYLQKKLFVFVNLRSYISDREAQLFLDTVRQHKYHIILVESHESIKLKGEKRYIIDAAYCEIQ